MIRTVQALGIAAVVAAVWILVLPPASIGQPIDFNHAKHADIGCATCHRGAETGIRAGIPQGQVCINCHTTAPGTVGAARWDRIEQGKPIGWIRVTHVPTHVFFSHRRHVISGGLACVSCHGDIGKRTTPPGYAPVRLTMSTCLSCHEAEQADEDCAACHR